MILLVHGEPLGRERVKALPSIIFNKYNMISYDYISRILLIGYPKP